MPWSIVLPQAIFANPLLSVVTPITTGTLIGIQTNRQAKTKQVYSTLKKPPLYPPPWVFAPVWTILYGMMGFAAHHATVSGSINTYASSTILQDWAASSQALYTSQLMLNYLWMPLFFGLRKPGWALADILLLGGNVAVLMHSWWKHDRVAFWLMAPYAAWLGFATYLNAGVGVLNGWTIGGRKKEE
ncbi:benzodiazepine receptor family protein [Aspergillus heteromorphus CBS 117.55]|uniref:Benzodiazepine receptor family protein n=1 Tax=Aspergillus heteromorphus CBS 117.55 TaxID=1448321 RepID=A0A317VNK3_9EURO|nr:benzodiazepine receptor family protein [Aspergillus heteromorphus CBS 117.55]PWY74432.1 benzodiazepine receptor family protein [Aspergillus heteromorphus CBS 117.55]